MDQVPSNGCTDFDKTFNMERIPTIQDLENEHRREIIQSKQSYVYKDFVYKKHLQRNLKKEYGLYNYCLLSVCVSFILGLVIGVILMSTAQSQLANKQIKLKPVVNETRQVTRTLNSLKNEINSINLEEKINNKAFKSVSFVEEKGKFKKDIYPKTLTEDMKNILKDNKEDFKHNVLNKTFMVNDNTILYNNVYWGPEVENSMPQGYGPDTTNIWERYVNQSIIVKMEAGCGRMQNRLVTFKDGVQACVRYRQNTDQIQGEIFSFYVAKLLNLTNLAPSVVKIVDPKDKLWKNVAGDISTVQWYSNRAVVLTQYIPSLEPASIPEIFKPSGRHLNKNDVLKMSLKEESKDILLDKLKDKKVKTKVKESFDHIDMKLNKKTISKFVELAQWSDLIIFDYLTANLDRIVNNLFNFQWNINIMDGPAHNLARKMDSGLLLFLDNESGLLHGYRLLKKYNVYHSLMLDNLCVFRKSTIEALKSLHESQSVGVKLSTMFHTKNNAVIRDILPPLPEKNAKILHERIAKVLNQVDKCKSVFSS